MLFTSYTFIGFILVLFIIYYSIPRRLQWVLLLGASYLFYACAGPRFLLYILATTTSTYFTSMKLDALDQVHGEGEGQLPRADKPAYRAAAKAKKLKWLLACLLFNFGILAVVKYANFTIYNINSVPPNPWQRQGPLLPVLGPAHGHLLLYLPDHGIYHRCLQGQTSGRKELL